MKRTLWIFLIMTIAWGCAPKREITPPQPPSVTPRVEYGWASWYGKDFHGRRTSSGTVYNMYELTAAHRTLSMGTRVMVTHQNNGMSVMVTINDRGPFIGGRVIDLSYAAAQAISMAEEGVAWVKVEVLDEGPLPQVYEGPFTIQVGSFVSQANALKLMEDLQRIHQGVFITELKTPETTYYRVRVGKFRTRDEAYAYAVRMAQDGYAPYITKAE